MRHQVATRPSLRPCGSVICSLSLTSFPPHRSTLYALSSVPFRVIYACGVSSARCAVGICSLSLTSFPPYRSMLLPPAGKLCSLLFALYSTLYTFCLLPSPSCIMALVSWFFPSPRLLASPTPRTLRSTPTSGHCTFNLSDKKSIFIP